MDKLIEVARQRVRDMGYINSINLAGWLCAWTYSNGTWEEKWDLTEIMIQVPCSDIHVVEYTNWEVKDYRIKDLFYYNPHGEDNES